METFDKIIIGVMVVFIAAILAIPLWDGLAKSSMIEQIHGVELPWYKATSAKVVFINSPENSEMDLSY